MYGSWLILSRIYSISSFINAELYLKTSNIEKEHAIPCSIPYFKVSGYEIEWHIDVLVWLIAKPAYKLDNERLRLKPLLVGLSLIIANDFKDYTAACLDNMRVNSFAFKFQIDSKA